MNILSGEPIGNIVEMKKTHPLHYDNSVKREPGYDDVSTSFADALMKALGKVNDLQTNSEDLAQKMMYEPESVDIHTVMIAAQKAEVAMSFTKAVRDEAIRAYRELINLR
ncbi:MAG TPA: flagellar hook-basal body complex protein FliE [Spirochaetota bacterium]|nr:flagellar hook-basal body complex protein FliE [Spirochaetota bacterium]HPG50230.1 flagellar hook-basal body complex protein FliE [Spirochaetota bacterium]HPN11286.1 flagellar hook-basal body complex protein FliE [Spirochaetota bacterium]